MKSQEKESGFSGNCKFPRLKRTSRETRFDDMVESSETKSPSFSMHMHQIAKQTLWSSHANIRDISRQQ